MDMPASYPNNLFEKFKERIVLVNFTQSLIKSVSQTALNNLKNERENATGLDWGSTIKRDTNFLCFDLVKNKKTSIGFKAATFAEHEQIMLLQHNRQYQWLLVEAYEAFEDYLARLYAYCGYMDRSFWPSESYINNEEEPLTDKEIKALSLDWFTRKTKKPKLESWLAQINKQIPSLAKILAIRKRNGPHCVDYEFTVVLASMLRHKIVHAHGQANKSNFAKELLEKSPWANKTKGEKQEYTSTIHSYFGNGTHENLITLLEIGDPASHRYLDRLNDLLARITSYAMLLRDLIQAHFEKKTSKS